MHEDLINHVFFPYTEGRAKAIKEAGLRLAYYTTAATAYSIIGNGELWMRNTSTMNDYRELEHGFECLSSAIDSEAGLALRAAVDACLPGISQKAIKHFAEWLPLIRSETYITCVSEHPDYEDANGRLSMWRAYGGSSGVALILRPDVMFKPVDVGIYAAPVAYWSKEQMQEEMHLIAQRIRANSDAVAKAEPEDMMHLLANMFRFAVMSTKHKGFAEEREWRLIACPALEKSPLLRQSVEVVRGVPQLVQRIVLKDQPAKGIHDVGLASILERVIIGPCE